MVFFLSMGLKTYVDNLTIFHQTWRSSNKCCKFFLLVEFEINTCLVCFWEVEVYDDIDSVLILTVKMINYKPSDTIKVNS